MGWKEAQERYRQGKTLTDQAVEDLVARRVLRGLGLTQPLLPKVERAIFDNAEYDEALWPRVKRLLFYALEVSGYAYYVNEHDFEVYETDSDSSHKSIFERFDAALPDIIRPVFLTRIKGTTTSMTYRAISPDDLHEVEPPFNAIASSKIFKASEDEHVVPAVLVVQETEHYIKQFDLHTFHDKLTRATYV